jgi:hypothetical protein
MYVAEDFPFSLNGALTGRPETRELAIDVRAAEPRENGLLATDEVIKLFALAVNEQLFSHPSLRAGLKLLTEQADDGGMRLRYQFLATAVPPAAFRVLLSLLAQTHHGGDHLARADIRSAQAWDGVDIQALLQPGVIAVGRPPVVGFDLDQRIEDGEAGFCAISVEFRDRLPRERFIAIREGFNIWDHLVMLGAFKPDFAEQEDFSEEYGQTAHQTPNTIEHATKAYDGSPAALNAVVTFLCRVHAELAPIRAVAIE